MHVVLVEPEIPANTGNIARTCAATGAILHLIKPLGFSVEDKYLKRAGLDYWNLVEIHYHENIEEFFAAYPDGHFWYATTKANQHYHQVSFQEDDFLLFGKETKGLPEELLFKNLDRCIKVPMISEARSLNLSNSVAIVLYEALRQVNFTGLK